MDLRGAVDRLAGRAGRRHLDHRDLVFSHLCARVPGDDPDHTGRSLIDPCGPVFEAITVSGLVKVDARGVKLDNTPFDVDSAGFVVHRAGHAARPDAACVPRLRTPADMAVSAQPGGVLPP